MRPAFTERPEAWTRSSRMLISPADYACAVEKHGRPSIWVRIATWLARWA